MVVPYLVLTFSAIMIVIAIYAGAYTYRHVKVTRNRSLLVLVISWFSWAFAVFSFVSGAAGYNAAVLLSYVLSGVFMYLLVYHYTGDRVSSVVAGIAFSVAPFRTTSLLSGHPTGFGIALLPAYIYCMEKFLSSRSYSYSILGGLCFLIMTDKIRAIISLERNRLPYIMKISS